MLDCYSHNINNSAQTSNSNFPESVSNTSATGMGPDPCNNKSTNSISGFEIPFMSQITDFISQKKKECLRLEKDRQLIHKDIVVLELQKDQVDKNLNKMIQKEKSAMVYLDWYYELRKMLLDNYCIKIEDDIPFFAKLINYFLIHGYDANEIINEYTTALSLRDEVIVKQANVQTLQIQNAALNKTNSHLESQVNMRR